MTRVGIRKLKNRLSKYVAQARKGQTIVVTDRGEPVAKLVPMDSHQKAEDALEARLQELAAAGHIRLAARPGDYIPFKPIRAKGKPLSQMIIEDRRYCSTWTLPHSQKCIGSRQEVKLSRNGFAGKSAYSRPPFHMPRF